MIRRLSLCLVRWSELPDRATVKKEFSPALSALAGSLVGIGQWAPHGPEPPAGGGRGVQHFQCGILLSTHTSNPNSFHKARNGTARE